MSHGYVDDIPGHAEFWNRFRCGHHCSDWWGRMTVRYGLLQRLREWKRNIRKLRKIYPEDTLDNPEDRLIYLEVTNILKNFT